MDRATIAALLGFAAAACFISIGFAIFPANIAAFAGILLSMAAQLVWRLARRQNHE
ncbi:MAG: hypothetical protein DIU80_022770 [Chloroflexota bacterium]